MKITRKGLKSARKGHSSSMVPGEYSTPVIQNYPMTYLTKNNDNEDFHDNYTSKLSDLHRKKADLEHKIEETFTDLKRVQAEESMANILPSDDKKLNKLIPIYKEKRMCREKMKRYKQKLEEVNAHISRIELMDKNLQLRLEIFGRMNLNPDKLKQVRSHRQLMKDPYQDRKIDTERLKQIKRGLYLDILENTAMLKMTFRKEERKYDLNRILESNKLHRQELEMRFDSVQARHRHIVAHEGDRILKIKKLKNSGHYHPVRQSLHPRNLMSRDADVELDDYYASSRMEERGYSATNRQPRIGRGLHNHSICKQ